MAWLMLPDLIFSDIMMMVGLESLESLHRCRQVCSTWNEMILRDIWESKSKKRIMKERIEKNWGPGMFPSDEEIYHAKWLEARGILDTDKIERLTERIRDFIEHAYDKFGHTIEGQDVFLCATSLALDGLLGSVENMTLFNLDLRLIPTQRLASLFSCVTRNLDIRKISGCDLLLLLTSLKCQNLMISSQSLGREETRALVQVMESGVQEVNLSVYGQVTLDIEALAEYSGQGVCREVYLDFGAEDKYREEMETWARSRNWTIEQDQGWGLRLNADAVDLT